MVDGIPNKVTNKLNSIKVDQLYLPCEEDLKRIRFNEK